MCAQGKKATVCRTLDGYTVWKLRTWTFEANQGHRQDSFSPLSTAQHCKRKPGFFISDEKLHSWPPSPRGLWLDEAQIQCSQCAKVQPGPYVPTGNRPQMSFSTGPCVTRFTFGGKHPCFWEKVPMTQIPQTNWPPVFHPGCFSVCDWQILKQGRSYHHPDSTGLLNF